MAAAKAAPRKWNALLKSKPFRKGYVYFLGALVGLYCLSAGYRMSVGPAETAVDHSASRKLLSSGGEIIPGFNGNCPDMASWENDSYALIHVIGVTYLFLGIAIICDEQFTSSLESICDPRTGLGLSPDVAGATFMAAGSSAPELASSCMGTFVSKSDVGLGTIIGSAVFNILIIIGATAIIVGEPMELDWKPLSRDTFFYCGSVTLMIIFVAGDKKIQTYEAGILLAYYGSYILWMVFNTGLMRSIAKMVGDEKTVKKAHHMPGMSSGAFNFDKKDKKDDGAAEGAGAGSGVGTSIPMLGQGSGSGADAAISDGTPATADATADIPGTPTMGNVDAPTPAEPTAADADIEAPAPKKESVEKKEEKEEEEEEEPGIAEQICEILSMPFSFAFDYTMPDCKYEPPDDEGADEEIAELEAKIESGDGSKAEHEAEIESLNKQKALRAEIEEAEEAEDDDKVEKLQKELFAMYEPLTWSQKQYLFTFGVSLIWITVLSYFMVTLMEKIGCAWGISSFIMGITFLAMGTSVPDALGSIAVAKEGEGDMAVSNAIGSNVFDICIGLGIPWFIATIIDGEDRPIIASTESVVASTCILFAVVVVLFTSLWSTKHPESGARFTLMPEVGMILFASYFAFVVFQIVWTAAGLPE